MSVKPKTAILLFSRSAHADASYKRLLSEKSDNVRLHDSLKRRVKQEAVKSGLPVFHFSESEQVGEGFGSRLYHAYQEIFKKGFDSVISIGSDCPDLSTSDLAHTYEELVSKSIVLGPDKRGGAYLIGLTKEAFHAEFSDLLWQSEYLLDSILAYADEHKLDIHLLDHKFDLNHRFEIHSLRNSSVVLRTLLVTILGKTSWTDIPEQRSFHQYQLRYQSRRGPPSLSTL